MKTKVRTFVSTSRVQLCCITVVHFDVECAHYVEVISANPTHSKETFDIACLDIVSCITDLLDSVARRRVGARSTFTYL